MKRERWHLLVYAFYFLLHFIGCFSLNPEGLALLEFRSAVENDPYEAFQNWNPDDENPCNWSGVYCIDGNVDTLYLNDLSLGGHLAPQIGKLNHLKALVLHNNNFMGDIPKEIAMLSMLELLDLRSNNLSGTIPVELEAMSSLKCLLLRDNKFQGGTPSWIEKVDLISDLKYDLDLPCQTAAEIGSTNRKVRHCNWQKDLLQLKKACTSSSSTNGFLAHDTSQDDDKNLLVSCAEPYTKQGFHDRRILLETTNLPAIPSKNAPNNEISEVPSMGSGSFHAFPTSKNESGSTPPPSKSPLDQATKETNIDETASGKNIGVWVYVLIVVISIIILLVSTILCVICRRKRGRSIGPRTTGLSGQLQKALVTGVPKLNRSELEAACEDFSNIITSFPSCILYKGTLSSGVEIGVVSTTIRSAAEWSERSELCFRKKIDTLSRVNHKNFVNLLGYCEDNEPFTRMMVFEYSPNGTLFDHLHVKEYEPLDWKARMRVIMGITYFLRYMHHDLNPPVALSDLHSTSVFISDDFSAKIVDISIFNEARDKNSIHGGNSAESQADRKDEDPESNVYSFGMLVLEIISGKLPYTEEGTIIQWGANLLDDERNYSSMIDPSLKTFEENELDVVCDTIRNCLNSDPKQRPTMKEVATALKNISGISPEAAAPRLSPLWWAELEILSVEAS